MVAGAAKKVTSKRFLIRFFHSFSFKKEKKDPLLWHISAIMYLIVLFILLSLAYTHQFSLSSWGFGDAQTVMTLKNWHARGIFNNYGLFLPQGYAPITHLLDKPEFRHHTHGISLDSAPGVGPRLFYTHCPPGYLYPFYLIYSTLTKDIRGLQIAGIFISVLALVFLYLLLSKVVSPQVAFFTIIFYSFSEFFIKFSGSLANMPIDDLFRFLIIFLIINSTKAKTKGKRNLFLAFSLLSYYLLSLSSFDSTFFILVWVICWDLIELKGIRILRILSFAAIPVFAFATQFLQNTLYLGFEEAKRDVILTLLNRGGAQNLNELSSFIPQIREKIHLLFLQNVFLFSGVVLIVFVYCIIRKKSGLLFFSLSFLLGGMAFTLFFPAASRSLILYEPRQLLPFAALLCGIGLKAMIDPVVFITDSFLHRGKKSIHVFRLFQGGLLTIILLLAVSFQSKHISIPLDGLAEMGAKIRPRTTYPPVIFNINALPTWGWVEGYPQIEPQIECFSESLILSFEDARLAYDDLIRLVKVTPEKFSPVFAFDVNTLASNQTPLALASDYNIPDSSLVSCSRVDGTFMVDLTKVFFPHAVMNKKNELITLSALKKQFANGE